MTDDIKENQRVAEFADWILNIGDRTDTSAQG
jgi:hypothetical protein